MTWDVLACDGSQCRLCVSIALVSAIVLVSIPGFAGQSEFGYCWTDSKSKLRDEEADSNQKTYLWKLNFQCVLAS